MDRFEDWNAELLLQVIQYLNVVDSGRFSLQSRRCYYLVHTCRALRGLELVSTQSLVSVDSPEQLTAEQLCHSVVPRLQSPPSLALAFSTDSNPPNNGRSLREVLPGCVPRETILLGVVTDSIQTASGQQGAYEAQSNNALTILAGLSPEEGTVVRPLYIETNYDGGNEQSFFESYREDSLDDNLDWNIFILYVCGFGDQFADALVETFQTKFPNATIIGGICSSAYVSVPIEHEDYTVEKLSKTKIPALQKMMRSLGALVGASIEVMPREELIQAVVQLAQMKTYFVKASLDCVCGVAISGNVPVRSFATRGVESLIGRKLHKDGTPQHQTSFYVHDAEVHQHGDEAYMFGATDFDGAPPYHLVRSIIDRNTGKVYRLSDICNVFGQPEFLGISHPHTDGYLLLEPVKPEPAEFNSFVLFNESAEDRNSTLQGANVDFFQLSGEYCLRDMDHCIEQLERATADEEVLGGIAFICNGRGPEKGSLVEEEMADAKRLARAFPTVPFMGFYAGGEIGATIRAGRQSVFGKEKAHIQGYTTVVAVFTKPDTSLGSKRTQIVDDNEQHINAFLRRKLPELVGRERNRKSTIPGLDKS